MPPRRSKREAPPTPEPRRLDLSVPGGRYIVAGQLVDAEGTPILQEQA